MTASQILDIASAQVGYTESPPGSNKTQYGAWYGMDGQPWCMMFVQWCFAKAGEPLPYKTASCSALERWYRAKRPLAVHSLPEPGDIVIYDFGHTGIVETVLGEAITAIEGNTSPDKTGSQNNGGGVYRRLRGRHLASCFIRPDYKGDEDMTGEEIYMKLTEYLRGLPAPEWAKEELWEAVDMGITDGQRPMELCPRYQAAIMAKRAAR